MIHKNGTHEDFDTCKIKYFFCKAYTNAAKNKTRWNKINFLCGNTLRSQVYNTPACMNHRSWKAFVKKFKHYKE